MSTLGTMRSRIEGEVDDTSISTEIVAAIQSAIKHYERKAFWFNQTSITFPTVADQEYYGSADLSTIPDILKIDEPMKAASGGYEWNMEGVTNGHINNRQNGAIEGRPCLYSYFNLQIRLYPIPDQVYTITGNVTYKLDTVTDEGAGNAWYQDAEELVRIRAKRILARDKTWDTEMYERLREGENEALNALNAETRLRLPQKRLRTGYPTGGGRYNIYTDS